MAIGGGFDRSDQASEEGEVAHKKAAVGSSIGE